ncbi:MAG: hypothetical protein P8I55_09540 [Crocinitomix sp.]|nr:hypothetical protein [Crocinitomix sp.]
MSWLVSSLEIIENGLVVFSPEEYDGSLVATFFKCKSKENYYCGADWLAAPNGLSVPYEYSISDDGTILRMESNFPVAEFRDTLIYDILELEKQTITLRLGDNDNQFTYTLVKK